MIQIHPSWTRPFNILVTLIEPISKRRRPISTNFEPKMIKSHNQQRDLIGGRPKVAGGPLRLVHQGRQASCSSQAPWPGQNINLEIGPRNLKGIAATSFVMFYPYLITAMHPNPPDLEGTWSSLRFPTSQQFVGPNQTASGFAASSIAAQDKRTKCLGHAMAQRHYHGSKFEAGTCGSTAKSSKSKASGSLMQWHVHSCAVANFQESGTKVLQ